MLLKSYVTYASSRGRELQEYMILDRDDEKSLKSYYDMMVGDDVYGDFESFLNGNIIHWKNNYGDCDTPIGGEMFLVTYEQDTKSVVDGFNYHWNQT